MYAELKDTKTKVVSVPTRAPKRFADCCGACNRPIKFSSDDVKHVRLVNGRGAVISREDSGRYPFVAGDGWFDPVGPECAKKFGPDFLFTEREAGYFIDGSFGRPASLGPVTAMEIESQRLTEAEIEEIVRTLELGQDLPDHWRRDLDRGSRPAPRI